MQGLERASKAEGREQEGWMLRREAARRSEQESGRMTLREGESSAVGKKRGRGGREKGDRSRGM